MGNENNNMSSYIYKVFNNNKYEKTEYYAIFEKSPFEIGACRFCYKGFIYKDGKKSQPNIFPSGKCVVKVFREKVAKTSDDLNEDFKNIFFSIYMSETFNSNHYYLDQKIYFNKPYLAYLYEHGSFELLGFIPIKDKDSMAKIKQDEWMAVEPFLDGEFKKYVSNTGLTYKFTENDEIIPFFMHWVWNYYEGEKVISDIQGIKRYNSYELTDPAVQSINREYGPTDLGCYGLLAFLIRHKCNKFCRELPWPNEEDVEEIKRKINLNLSVALIFQKPTYFLRQLMERYNEEQRKFIDEVYREVRYSVFYKIKDQEIKKKRFKCHIF